MKKTILVPVLLLFFITDSFSQIAGNAVYNNNMSTFNMGQSPGVNLDLNPRSYNFSNVLEASVMINVKVTSWVAIFSLTQNGKTIEETENMMRTRIDLFKNLLGEERIMPEQVFVDPVSLVPSYEIEVTEKKFSKTLNEVPSGFEMKKNVHITFNNHDQINRLITIAAKAEIYDLVKVDYVVNDMTEVLSQLRDQAMTVLVNKKETLEKAGMHLRFSKLGEMYGSVYPVERYAQYYAYKTGVTPSYVISYRKGQSQQVQYNYAEKNKTIYYEKVSDKQFDKIINPVVNEPVVQVYLSLKGEYEVYDPETEATNKVYAEKMRQLQQKDMELNLEAKMKDIELKGKAPKTKK